MSTPLDFCDILNVLAPPTQEGAILEFGVWHGRSIKEIAMKCPTRKIIGFDHWRGLGVSSKTLPLWQGATIWQEGSYRNDTPEETLVDLAQYSNVRIIQSDILELESPEQYDIGPIVAVNIDTDIYEPAKAALNFVSCCQWDDLIIRFDDWHADNAEFDNHERLAFQEWIAEHNYWYDMLENGPEGVAKIKRETC